MNPGTSDHICSFSAAEPKAEAPHGDRRRTPPTVSRDHADRVCKPLLGASELTPSRLTYETGCCGSVRLTAMSSPVRQANDTTDDPNPKPNRRDTSARTGRLRLLHAGQDHLSAMTIAARVPSRDSCSSLIDPESGWTPRLNPPGCARLTGRGS
ncbi:hypothetical protein I552_0274 [Mycobacterium xenopi 3993]|nr:hypothetical protein I552_0274 [Mycobacterium xenopi 3993]